MDHPPPSRSLPQPETATGSAVASACDALERHVASGRWPGGYTLIEADLVEHLGVSRSTVREALRRVESEGLVVRGRGRNLVVRRLSRRDVSELYELREVLEGHAAGKAAGRFADMAPAERAAFAIEADWWAAAARSDSVEALSAANGAFHAHILAMAGNRHLPRLVGGTLMTLFVSQFRGRLDAASGLLAARDHVAISTAVLQGDAAAASRAMRTHIRGAARWIQALPDDAFGTA